MNCPTVAASTPIAPRTGDGVLPLNSRLELAALLTAPGCARAHVRAILLEWGLPDVAETAELLVSELVTNSLQASGRLKTRADLPLVPVIRLWVASDRVSVAIHVWDASDDLPIRRDADVDEISGRGLMIIDTLAKDWGSSPSQREGGLGSCRPRGGRGSAMSDARPEFSEHGHPAGRQRAAGRGTITRLTIGVQCQTEQGTTERYYAMQLPRSTSAGKR